MSERFKFQSEPRFNPTELSCYSVATCAFAASVLGLGFSHWPSGALAGVGGFYFVTALFSRTFSTTDVATENTPNHVSSAHNLVAEAVIRTPEANATVGRARDLVRTRLCSGSVSR